MRSSNTSDEVKRAAAAQLDARHDTHPTGLIQLHLPLASLSSS